MGKRLDVQSLLEKCSKSEIDRFLKLRFAKNKVLESDFLVHFAASFDLDDQHLTQIIKRVERTLPKVLSKITVKKANKAHDYITNLIEQARDCIYANNFNQSFLLLSNLTPLLDRIIPEIPPKYNFDPFLSEVYRLFDLLYNESPARPLKTKIEKHLKDIISDQEGIITDRKYNPYALICKMNPKAYADLGFDLLEKKLTSESNSRKKWIETYIDLLVQHKEWSRLNSAVNNHSNENHIFKSILVHSETAKFPNSSLQILKDTYFNNPNRGIKNTIYYILTNQKEAGDLIVGISLEEYYESGDLSVIHKIENTFPSSDQLLEKFTEYYKDNENLDPRLFYKLLLEYNKHDELIYQLQHEQDIFIYLDYISSLYSHFPDQIKDHTWNLTHTYLSTHFGRPALIWLNKVINAMDRNNISSLQNHIMTNIKKTFGHRRHFQKLMKEIA